ncbi:hypothetical protein MPER_00780, partial [Moniliophthora perniciosa FA553]
MDLGVMTVTGTDWASGSKVYQTVSPYDDTVTDSKSSFLTMRVWRLSKENVPLTAIIGALVLAEFGDYFYHQLHDPVLMANAIHCPCVSACSVAFTIKSMKLVTWEDLTQLR